MNLPQVQSLQPEELKDYVAKASARKNELVKLKANNATAWDNKLQDELNEITIFLVDAEEALESGSTYMPKPGTEDMIHVSLIQGRRFNPLTGKEESKEFTQIFTFAEWQLFKKNYRNLGYIVTAVLHDPYGDANDIVTKI